MLVIDIKYPNGYDKTKVHNKQHNKEYREANTEKNNKNYDIITIRILNISITSITFMT